jgi:hypothetical protein
VPLPDRMPTASERIYRKLLDASTDDEYAGLEGQLVAICTFACRRRGIAPPYEWQPNSKHASWKGRWVGGPFSLSAWVLDWVGDELSGDEPLIDGGRYIGRRCVNALIDKIRWYKRRKLGAKERFRKLPEDDDWGEEQWSRNKVQRAFSKIGLPRKLPIAGDRELFERLVVAYPKRLTNVAIARELGVSEGAIRKRRKRISQACLAIVTDHYLRTTVFKQLGFGHGYEK